MKLKLWSVSHGKDGYHVELYEVPLYAEAVERALIGPFMSLTANCPEKLARVLEKIPAGKPEWVKDGDEYWNAKSLYSRLWDLGQWPGQFAWKRTKRVFSVPISLGTAMTIEPAWVAECEEIFSDDAA